MKPIDEQFIEGTLGILLGIALLPIVGWAIAILLGVIIAVLPFIILGVLYFKYVHVKLRSKIPWEDLKLAWAFLTHLYWFVQPKRMARLRPNYFEETKARGYNGK